MLNWDGLKSVCADCTRCGLCETRHNVVFGVGNEDADIMFVGEGPGEQEDLKGQPFVGPAGKLLDDMLCIIDLSRETNCYIANIVKCRPPHNRDPLETEQDACIGYLRNQVALVKPKIIVCLGRIAAKRLIDPDYRITRQHGQWVERNGVWMTAIYHPSALLRDVSKRPETFDDLLAIRAKIREMAKETIAMVTDSVDAYVKQDVYLAKAVQMHDDVVDNYFTRIKSGLIDMIAKNPAEGEYALDLLMIAKYFERIGDHATNIAEWVEFSVTGIHNE